MKKIVIVIIILLCVTGCKKYTCPDGYELNGKECYADVEEDAIIKQTCEDGYKLDKNVCKKETVVESKKIESCLKGYEKDNDICILVSTKNANKKTWCEKGTNKNGACYTFSVTDAKVLGKYCPDGYNTEGNRCYKKTKTKAQKDAYGILKCPSGQTLELGYCIKKTYTDKVNSYICTTGTLKGTKCEITTWAGMPKVEYSCPKGYNLIGIKCSKTDVKGVIINYKCEKGFELDKNNKCKKITTVSPKEVLTCDDELELKNNKCIGKRIIKASKAS